MPKLVSLPAKKIIKILEAHGFVFDHATGSHYFYHNITAKRLVAVPFHRQDVKKGTLLSIINQAGLDKALFRK
jgi:predicted RNA binding protein YcfA (HicA-like mRNA interferase family)